MKILAFIYFQTKTDIDLYETLNLREKQINIIGLLILIRI